MGHRLPREKLVEAGPTHLTIEPHDALHGGHMHRIARREDHARLHLTLEKKRVKIDAPLLAIRAADVDGAHRACLCDATARLNRFPQGGLAREAIAAWNGHLPGDRHLDSPQSGDDDAEREIAQIAVQLACEALLQLGDAHPRTPDAADQGDLDHPLGRYGDGPRLRFGAMHRDGELVIWPQEILLAGDGAVTLPGGQAIHETDLHALQGRLCPLESALLGVGLLL